MKKSIFFAIFLLLNFLYNTNLHCFLHKPGWRNPLKGWIKDGFSFKKDIQLINTNEKFNLLMKSEEANKAFEIIKNKFAGSLFQDSPKTNLLLNNFKEFIDTNPNFMRRVWLTTFFVFNSGRRLSQSFRKSHFE